MLGDIFPCPALYRYLERQEPIQSRPAAVKRHHLYSGSACRTFHTTAGFTFGDTAKIHPGFTSGKGTIYKGFTAGKGTICKGFHSAETAHARFTQFLQKELPVLLDAYLKTVKEDIIIYDNKISIIGDSVLSDYSYVFLLFNLTQPYTPWKVNYVLDG